MDTRISVAVDLKTIVDQTIRQQGFYATSRAFRETFKEVHEHEGVDQKVAKKALKHLGKLCELLDGM